MANFLDLLQGQLSDGLINQLSSQIGANPQQTATAAQGIMTTLLSGLAKNASTPEGAASLANALDNDHDGSVINNLMGLFSGGAQAQPSQARALNGAGILSHILGDRQSGAIDMISKMSGLDSSKTGSLMTMLAPMIMGMLGRQKQQQGLNVSSLANLLTGAVTQQNKSGNPLMDMANRFLDKDGDGSALNDIAGMVGKGLLGKLFGGK